MATQAAPGSVEARFQAARKAADDIFKRIKSEGDRSLTPAEVAQVEKHLDLAESLKGQIDASNRAKSLTGGMFGSDVEPEPAGGVPATGNFKSGVAASWATEAGELLKSTAEARGGSGQNTPLSKALIGVSVVVPSILTETVVKPSKPVNVLELIPRENQTGSATGDVGNAFSYLVEGVSTAAAKSVPDGATKPTSTLTFDEKDDKFRVFATLSEALPERYLDDYAGLVRILQTRLGEWVIDAVEAAVVNGDLTTNVAQSKDEFTGILKSSGIQTVAAVTGDLLTTLSNARLALTNANEVPTAWVLNPVDLQKLELMRESGTTGAFMFRSGRSQLEDVLGAPIVTSTKLTAGTALVGDFQQTRLLVRQDTTLAIDGSGSRFTTNQVAFRVEGRYGLQVLRPLAFAKVTLP